MVGGTNIAEQVSNSVLIYIPFIDVINGLNLTGWISWVVQEVLRSNLAAHTRVGRGLVLNCMFLYLYFFKCDGE